MGSLSPQLPSTSSPENSSTVYRIYASFCSRDLSSRASMSNWIDCYSPLIHAWHRVTTIPGLVENQVLKGFSMASIGDNIYIIGGRLCHKVPGHEPDDVVEVNLDVLSWVLRYDVRNDVWSKCASLRVPRFDFACTVCDDKIYVAGGQSTFSCARGISSAEVYDPALDEWKALPEMNTLRYKCVGVTWQGRIHVVGGFADQRGDRDRVALPWGTIERSSAEMYNPENAKWDLIKGMWLLDIPPNQIVAVDDKLFSSGDCLNAWKGHIEAYDGKLNMWNEVDGSHLETLSSPISTSIENWPPIKRLYLTMAPIGTQLYFLAGYRLPGEISRVMCNVHVFDTSANGYYGWTSLEPVEEEGEKELCSHCCVVRQIL
ncbi:F-box/kelch-repeat protein [Melia azedarach]|uniref:F-box/kelch-repeat protein n=1 Tax=Melia azedarach TaxID=155640 RepID=A0ACC1Z2L7_MELAZ|nr:F-box/kelch-repeat protein [Melia azedarach]